MEFKSAFMCILQILLAFYICHTLFQKYCLRLPPSPWPLPLIGHLHLLGGILHRTFQSLSNRYGPIFYLQLGTIPAIIISSPELAKAALKDQDHVFASRPYTLFGEYVSYNFRGMVFAPYNKHWKNMRKLCATELFTSRRIDSFAWIRSEELSSMFPSLVESYRLKRTVNCRELLTTFTFNVMTKTLMSKKFLSSTGTTIDEEAKEFKEVADEIARQTIHFHISEFVPRYLRWIDWTTPQTKKLHQKLDNFMQRILEEHKLSKKSRIFEDITDIMLEFEEANGKDGETTVKSMILELFVAGTTSAAVIEWALAELLKNPHFLKKAQDELDMVVGEGRLVNESDFINLEYLQAIVKETFRLHPPAPVLFPRMTLQDCHLAGFKIPKGTTTFINVYAISQDPLVWKKPNEFNPNRFLVKAIDVKGQDFELIPFGSGRRSCPGMMLGLKTVQLVLSNLLHAFDWSCAPGSKLVLEEVSGNLAWLKAPLEATASPRFDLDFYYGKE